MMRINGGRKMEELICGNDMRQLMLELLKQLLFFPRTFHMYTNNWHITIFTQCQAGEKCRVVQGGPR